VILVQTYRSDECYALVTKDDLEVCGDRHLKLWTEDFKYRQYTFQGVGTTNLDGHLKTKSSQNPLKP
jgi:hypothetical protein